eukprot:CAMPEP_0201691476 /NCGR_PEP_ID=MMETSP0578-20130828/4626_1 /ASSEMBLY_ACC=CAM_ASM_000663 /TAXON_ID=267565 /ORGANISM="Skeletonema grethea, Strain CCMP 1804" /LENGTH=219 /DNA_ID=CAMNT_0048176687 /DNA_START=278 /DNA_END=937 /DNA_ORIENTATION=-
MGAVIERDSDVYTILGCEDGSLCRLVNSLVEDEKEEEGLGSMILSPDIPIEIRIYEKQKAGMAWHVDDIIYQNTKQIEVVFTLENTSDCCTMWRPHDQLVLTAASAMSCTAAMASEVSLMEKSSVEEGSITSSGDGRKEANDDNRFRVESVQTTPNSAILIKAGGVLHKVSPLSYGRRVILKMAFVREGALMSDEMKSHVSHHNGSGGKRKKKNRKKKR